MFSPLSRPNAFSFSPNFLSFYYFSLLHFLSSSHLSFLTTLPKLPNPPWNLLPRWRMPGWACRPLCWSGLQRQGSCLWTLTQRFWPRSGRQTAWREWIWRSHRLLLCCSRNRTPWKRTTTNYRWISHTVVQICKNIKPEEAIRGAKVDLWKSIKEWLHTVLISFPFQLMLSENTRVRAKIQSAFEQLAMPHVAKVSCGYYISLNYIIKHLNCSPCNVCFLKCIYLVYISD